MSNKNNTYEDRMKVSNYAENQFQIYCKKKGLEFYHLGFDKQKVEHFYLLNPIIRNIPDYVVWNDEKIFLVQVKGSPILKQKEYELFDKMISAYESDKVKLYYAYCFNDDFIFLSFSKMKLIYENEPIILRFENDGKSYKMLNELIKINDQKNR